MSSEEKVPCPHAKKYMELIERNIAALEKLENRKSLADLLQDKEDELSESIKTYMLEHFNLSFVNDELEGEVYDFLLKGIFKVLNKVVL